MVFRWSDSQTEPTAHGFEKRILARGGALPDVTQVAVAVMPSESVVEPHAHRTMYEIFFVLEGDAVYVIDGKEYAASPGDLVVAPPGAIHSVRVGRQAHRVFYWGIATGPNPG
jgi:mannose-6-phosphate isomerase-like protein (cupin superfamily)